TFKLFAAIHDEDLWKPTILAHTVPEHHHARSITRWIEGEKEGQQAAGKPIDQDGPPGAAEIPVCAGAKQLHVEFRVIDMADMKRPVTMPRSGELQFQVRGLDLI